MFAHLGYNILVIKGLTKNCIASRLKFNKFFTSERTVRNKVIFSLYCVKKIINSEMLMNMLISTNMCCHNTFINKIVSFWPKINL